MVMKLYGDRTSNVQRAILPLFLAQVDLEKKKKRKITKILEMILSICSFFFPLASISTTTDLEEEVEFVRVDLTKHNKSAAYMSKQIFGAVPYLEDGHVAVFESRAIAKYIVEKYLGKCSALLGTTLNERATINMWMESEAHNLQRAVAPVFKEKFESQGGVISPEVVSKGKAGLNAFLDAYERHLSQNTYLAGENYTLADAFHTPAMHKVNTMDELKIVLDGSHRPNVARWVKEITSHEAFQKCLQINWEAATPFPEHSAPIPDHGASSLGS